MSEPEDTAAVLDRAHRGDAEGEAYHGPALRVLLSKVTAAGAAARPLAGAHSIAEIVRHLTAWLEFVRARLAGDGTPTASLVPDDGWTAVTTLSDEAWRADVAALDAAHERLLRAVRSLNASGVERARDLLRFALHHGVYHAGQIGLLRRATS